MSEANDNIRAWQFSPYLHPLTCGVSSLHDVLEIAEDGENMVCPTCGYVQPISQLPDMVTKHGKEIADEHEKVWGELMEEDDE